mgnify:CR=1 FL=1
MLKNYKYSLFVFALFFLFLELNHSVLALEVNYPPLPLYVVGPGITLAQYIEYIFVLIILSAAGIGIIIIVIAGFQILLSFGNPAARGAAMERIRNAILGIILLMSSVIILTTINIELVTPKTTFSGLTSLLGVYLRSPHPGGYDENHPDGFEYIPAPASVSDMSYINLPTGPIEIGHFCDTPGANLLVWLYSKPIEEPDYNPRDGTETTISVPCNTPTPILSTTKSFETAYEEPGIYFYKSPDCTGYSSSVQKEGGNITFYYTPQINSVRVVSGFRANERYGVILSKESGLEGECSEPMIQFTPGETCFGAGASDPIANDWEGNPFADPYYAFIIKYNPNYTSYGDIKGEVKIYSENLFAVLKQTGGIDPIYDINQKYIYLDGGDPNYNNPNNLIREQYKNPSYNGHWTSNDPGNECCTEVDPTSPLKCDDLDPNGSCLKGIQMNGSYYVFLYSGYNGLGNWSCDYFTTHWDDIPNQTNLLNDYKILYKLIIIPRY